LAYFLRLVPAARGEREFVVSAASGAGYRVVTEAEFREYRPPAEAPATPAEGADDPATGEAPAEESTSEESTSDESVADGPAGAGTGERTPAGGGDEVRGADQPGEDGPPRSTEVGAARDDDD